MWAIYKKEMRSYLLSPIAWILWFVFAWFHAWGFNTLLNRFMEQSMMSPEANATSAVEGGALGFVRFLFLIIIPFVAMRLFAEEKQTGTIELLYTFPLTDLQIVLGKLAAALTIAVGTLVTTLPQVIYLSRYVPLDWPVLGSMYFGLALMIVLFMTFGELISALSNSQLVAVIVTFVGLLLMWMANVFTPLFQNITLDMQVSWFMKPFLWIAWALVTGYKSLAISEYGENFSRGIINSNDVVMLLSLSFFFVFLTLKKLETRKWRG